MNLYGIFGAGGHGREVMPLARLQLSARLRDKAAELVFVVESEPENRMVNGHRVLTKEEFLGEPVSTRYFNVAISSSTIRERIANEMAARLVMPFSIVAQNHASYDGNEIGEGAILSAFSCITCNARIGRFFHANIYSYVAHDCVIGDFVTFAPNVHCNGSVVIEDHVYVGTGAIIREGTPDRPVVIGRGAVIGMGSVVTKSVPANTTVIGNPARELSRH